jgi:Uma2 family endonuclease
MVLDKERVDFSNTSIAPLESGDRLSRYEFERRYAASNIKKAELIEGVVYVASPLRFRSHAVPHSYLIAWLVAYQAATPGVLTGIEPTIRLDLDNEPQPDAVLLLEERCGGRSRLADDDYLEGSPELVVEVAASSVSKDLNAKKNAYRRNGIQEYIVWQMFENQLVWFALQEGEYVLLEPDENGIIHSQVFPGLWLAVPALLAGDTAQVLAVVQQGIASAEHQAFRERLSLLA